MAGSGTAHLRPEGAAVLRAEHLTVEFPAGRKRVVHAVCDVSLDLLAGETLGVVGESGCGKTTLGRALMQLIEIREGSVSLGGVELTSLDDKRLRRSRRQMQMIFQDPVSSLNPRRTVHDLVREGLAIWGDAEGSLSSARVDEILADVGIDPVEAGDRRPHEFSGGQCQRICIARALVLDPAVLICDEPTSALDVSVQAQILNLLRELRNEFGLAMLFITHDLSVVRYISDRVMVMYLGKVCEVGTPDVLFRAPGHPYTRALLAAIPGRGTAEGRSGDVDGELPSPIEPPSGCRFRTRCPQATDRCAAEEPELRAVADDHYVACHHF